MTEMTTTRTVCPVCLTESEVTASALGIEAWQCGLPIQTALPTLTPTEREMLVTGICGECWDLLGDDDE